MKIQISVRTRLLLAAMATISLISSCKYQDIQPSTYPEQKLYMTTALGVNGVYTINTVPGPLINGAAGPGPIQFTVDLASGKLIIPLSVNRSGVSLDGAAIANIALNTDTVTKLVAKSALTGITVPAADKLSLPAAATVSSGATFAPFNVALDLNYLRANNTKLFAFGVSINSTQRTVNPLLNTTVLVFDAKILKPTAMFSSAVNVSTKTATFANTSLYGTGYSWDFGDNTPLLTTLSPVHTYAASGTYSVKLVTTGVTGSQDAATYTATVVIP